MLSSEQDGGDRGGGLRTEHQEQAGAGQIYSGVLSPMPGSDRGDLTKTALIAGVVVAVLLAAAVIGWGWLQSSKYERDADDQAREYAAYADKQIRQSCPSPILRDVQDCIAKARNEQRTNEREERDLVAQRQSTLWAFVMAAAAVVGLVLSVFGVILVWTTFRATRQGNILQKRIGEAQTRAYISIIDCFGFLSEEKVPQFSFTIKNSGSSPALRMKVQIELTLFTILDSGERRSFEGKCTLSGIYSVPATDKLKIPLHGVELPPAPFFEFKFLQILVLIKAEWDDVFGERRMDKEVFAALIEEWPDGPFQLPVFHSFMAEIGNDVLRRKAKGEWDEKPA